MTSERKKLSLGNVAARAEERHAPDKTRSWNVSPARAEALKERARTNRRHPSAAQALLWERLKDKKCASFTFNREVIMGSTIVDFACKSRWLVIETGAETDAEKTHAALSDRKLQDVGVRVLRFSDAQVLEDIEAVVEAIKTELLQPFERPRLPGGRVRTSDTPQGEGEQRFHRSRH